MAQRRRRKEAKARPPAKPKPLSTTWPTRAAAAADLAVITNQPTLTAKTLEGWLSDPACTLPRGRGAIPKIPVLIWLLQSKRERGRPADSASTAAKDAQAAIWQAKADAIRGRVVKWEAVNDAIATAVDGLRRDMTEDIPAAVGEMIGKRTQEEAVEETSALGAAALNRFAQLARPPGAHEDAR